MTVCEMQNQFELKDRVLKRALADSLQAAWRLRSAHGEKLPYPKDPVYEKAGGIGAAYCKLISKYFHVRTASAAEVPRYSSQDSVRHAQRPASQDSVRKASQDSVKKASQDSAKKASQQPKKAVQSDSAKKAAADSAMRAAVHAAAIAPAPPGTFGVDAKGKPINAMPPRGAVRPLVPIPATAATATARPNPQVDTTMESQNASKMEINDAKMRLDEARHWRNRYGVEIQKKFSLAFACIVFVLVGAPIALRFPRGGVGLVIGVSFLIFAIYYVWLTVGESFADKNIISPGLAMWGDNVLFLVIGLAFVARMGHERVTGRGGGFGETMDATRAWFARLRKRGGA
jgi:lipopolysaccharide export system permease protein